MFSRACRRSLGVIGCQRAMCWRTSSRFCGGRVTQCSARFSMCACLRGDMLFHALLQRRQHFALGGIEAVPWVRRGVLRM